MYSHSKKLLTIAIPSYNAQEWLKNCIETILSSNRIDEIEILIIDDGSTDSTLEIALGYENLYSKSVKAIHQSNGGWGSAVKTAISEASGKYFKVVDADDWVNVEGLNSLLNLTELLEIDIIASAFVEHSGEEVTRNHLFDKKIVDKTLSFKEYLRSKGGTPNLPLASLTYKTSMIMGKQHLISDRYYADIEFNLNLVFFAKNIYFSNVHVYCYWRGRDGQSTSIDGYKKNKQNYLNLCLRMSKYYMTIPDHEYKFAYKKECIRYIGFLYELYLSPVYTTDFRKSTEELTTFENELKSTSQDIYRKSLLCIRRRKPHIFFFRILKLNIYKLKKH